MFTIAFILYNAFLLSSSIQDGSIFWSVFSLIMFVYSLKDFVVNPNIVIEEYNFG